MGRRTDFPEIDPEIAAAIDAALLPADEEVAPAEPPPKARRRGPRSRLHHEEFFMGPVWLLREINRARAWRALPLILAAYRRMRMRKEDSIALTEQIWAECGEPGEGGRRAVLAQIRKIPGIVVITPEHRLQWRHRLVLGALWALPSGNEKPK